MTSRDTDDAAVRLVLVADRPADLTWIERGTQRLSTEVSYLPIQRIDKLPAPSYDGDSQPAAAHEQAVAAAADVILSGSHSRLRWVVREGQYLRQAARRTDRALVADHVAGTRINPALLVTRRADRRRLQLLRDEFGRLSGEQPAISPF